MRLKHKLLYILFLLIIFLQFSHTIVRANPEIVKNIDVSGKPLGLAVDEAGKRLFVLNHPDGILDIISENGFNIIKKISLNRRIDPNLDTRSVAYDSGLNRIYITTGWEGVFGIDGSSYKTLFKIKKGIEKRFIPDLAITDNYLYLLDWDGYVHKYNKNGILKTSINIKNMGSPRMLVGSLGRVYLSSGKNGLIVVDPKESRVVATIPVDALSIPEGSWNAVYVAGPKKLYMIDSKDLKVKETMDVDYTTVGGLGMALNPNTGHLFLVTDRDTVTVVDTKKWEKVDILKVCNGPRSIAINKETSIVYVACPGDNRITVIKDE